MNGTGRKSSDSLTIKLLNLEIFQLNITTLRSDKRKDYNSLLIFGE